MQFHESSLRAMVAAWEALPTPFGADDAARSSVVAWYSENRMVLALILPCPCEPVDEVNEHTAAWAASCGTVACAHLRARLQ